jgi:anti-sigma factor RsiW
MNPQEIFDAWKAQGSQDDVSRDFPDRVMAAIRRREATRVAGGLALLRGIAARPWARVAALILGTLLGLARILATLHLILFA